MKRIADLVKSMLAPERAHAKQVAEQLARKPKGASVNHVSASDAEAIAAAVAAKLVAATRSDKGGVHKAGARSDDSDDDY